MMLSSIPSPSDKAIGTGPLELRADGLVTAVGVIVAVGIARRRWAARGRNPDDVFSIAGASVIPVAQAIGSRGAGFNQELFGGPTDLPGAGDRPRPATSTPPRSHPTFPP